MIKKINLSKIEIIILSLISLIILIILFFGIINIFQSITISSMKTLAYEYYNRALEEKITDGDVVKKYCYKTSYGYPKTLDNSDTKSLKDNSNNTSYYMEFNDKGAIIEMLIISGNYSLYLSPYVNEISIDSINKNDIINLDKAYKILEKCEYRAG